MKNAINYYYNLNPINIHQTNKKYKFKINNNEYVLVRYDRNEKDINILYDIHINLRNQGIYCHEIILNVKREIITIINNEPYVLLKVDLSNSKVTMNEIINFSNQYILVQKQNPIRRDNWYQLWTNKIDYLEYQLTQIGKKYPIIRESIAYYIGMAETSISLLNRANNENINLSIAHKRIKKNTSSFEIYNPLNFIIDLRIRDISEYFKDQFFNHENILEPIKIYIKNNYLTSYEIYMLYVRMLFPTYYFDLYEEVISQKKKEEELLKIINQANNYQKFLKDLYLYIKQFINIDDIEWIMKT